MRILPYPSFLLAWTGVVSICLVTTASVQASFKRDRAAEEPLNQGADRSEFELMVECDPLHAHGSGAGYKSRVAQIRGARMSGAERLGLRPPKCIVEATQDGGSFACECADGSKSKGKISPVQAHSLHKDAVDSFEWCEGKIEEACGALTPPMESICENDHGVCSIIAYSRTPDAEFSDLEQTCECNDDRTWVASTPVISSFKIEQKTLDQTCRAEMARCAPSRVSERASKAIELPQDILSYPKALGCMDSFGTCKVYSDENKYWTDCRCFADEHEGFGVEAPWPLDSIQDMLFACHEDLDACEPEDLPEPDVEPDTEGGDDGPSAPDGEQVEPKPDILPIGCTLGKAGSSSLLGLLFLCLLPGRRRR